VGKRSAIADLPTAAKQESGLSAFLAGGLVRRQQSFIAIAVAIYLAMWAVDRPAPIGPMLPYTLTLCNIIFFVQAHLGFLYTRERRLHTWLLYIPLLLGAGTFGVTAVNLIEFPSHRAAGQTVWQFLESGGKCL
jgi:hypothetical protein